MNLFLGFSKKKQKNQRSEQWCLQLIALEAPLLRSLFFFGKPKENTHLPRSPLDCFGGPIAQICVFLGFLGKTEGTHQLSKSTSNGCIYLLYSFEISLFTIIIIKINNKCTVYMYIDEYMSQVPVEDYDILCWIRFYCYNT